MMRCAPLAGVGMIICAGCPLWVLGADPCGECTGDFLTQDGTLTRGI